MDPVTAKQVINFSDALRDVLIVTTIAVGALLLVCALIMGILLMIEWFAGRGANSGMDVVEGKDNDESM